MGHNTNYGFQLGSSLGSIFGAALGGGQGGGRSAAYEDFQRKAAADESLADAAFKRRQTAPDAAEMALNELGISGTQRDALMRAVTGQKKPEEVNYLPNGEVNFANSGGATAQDAAIPDQLMKAFLQAQNDYASVAPSNIDQIQKARGQRQENQYVDDIAQGGYKPDLGKALLLSKGKAPFAGNAFNSTDITSGKQAINPIGTSLIGLNSDKGQQALAGAALNYSGINENEAQTEAIRHGMGVKDQQLSLEEQKLLFDQSRDFRKLTLDEKKYSDSLNPKIKTGAVSEDERKAAGWFMQASNAHKNMLKAIEESPSADSPGLIESIAPNFIKGAFQDKERQKYTQAISSFSEAALRAATGAGVNKDEAKQKIEELSPQYFDSKELKKQKADSLLIYLDSLKSRAGRAIQSDGATPSAANNTLSLDNPLVQENAKKSGLTPEEYIDMMGGM